MMTLFIWENCFSLDPRVFLLPLPMLIQLGHFSLERTICFR